MGRKEAKMNAKTGDDPTENHGKVYRDCQDGLRIAVMLDTASERVRRICTSPKVRAGYSPRAPSQGHTLTVPASQLDMFLTLGGDGTPILMLDLIRGIKQQDLPDLVPLVFVTDDWIKVLSLREEGTIDFEPVGHMDWPGPHCNCPTCVGNRREKRTETLNDFFARWGEAGGEARHGFGGKSRLD